MADKQDSNLTGLRYAEETSLKVLPGSPVWQLLEPNSYSDFGGQLTTVARNPINASRQRKKGTVTDLDASGGFNQDLTMNNLTRLMQGVLFSNAREKYTTAPLNAAAIAFTSVTSGTKTYAAASGLGTVLVGALLMASGFTNAGNNGLKTVASRTAGTIVVVETAVTEASPPAAAKLVTVGFQLGSATSAITANGNLRRLTDSATDFTTLGLVAGEWVWVGGDGAATRFTVAGAFLGRVATITAGYLEFDKLSTDVAAEAGTGKTIQLFLGMVIRNEQDPNLIVRRTYNVERSLGNDGTGTMSEYLVGAVANEFTLNIPQADKVNADFTFTALDNEQRNGTTGLKSGTRPNPTAEEAINTSSDVTRIKLSLVDNTDSFVSPLFAYATEVTLTINNNVSPNKAVGVLGGFDTTTGTFEVGGSITAYFANVEAVQAVRNNLDITLDIFLQRPNSAFLFDIPLLSLGDGRLNVEQDAPITLPLENNAAESKFGYTLLIQSFQYMPSIARP